MPKPDERLEIGDKIVLLGTSESVEKIKTKAIL